MVNAFRWMIFVVIGLAVVIGSIMVTSAQEPLLTIESPYDGETVDFNTITVSGYAMGTSGAVVDLVTVNGVPATGTSLWSAEASLQPGPNPITVVAKDEMGEECSETITVYYPAPITSPSQPPRDHEAPSATPTLTVSISITSIPSGAKVYLDNFFKGTTPTLVNVTVGSHEIKVTKEGYRRHSESKSILLGDGEPEEMIIVLKPFTGSIAVFSTPPGASVYLDDDDMNKSTPCLHKKVVVGQHTIKLTKSGYDDVIRDVSVFVGETLYLNETLTKSTNGFINISSVPSGAKVCLDGNWKGETPKNISTVAQRNHTIKLTLSDYFDVIRNVSVFVGETLYLNENLTGYGSLYICSDPSEAKVYLDGDCKGETALNISKVVVGTHSIKLTKLGYPDAEKIKHVSAGELTEVDVTLSISPWVSLLIQGGAMGVIFAIIVIIFKVVSPKLKEKYLLFSLDPSYRPYLKEGDVDEKLKKVFEDNGVSFSTEPKLVKPNKKPWEIVNGETQYRIKDTEKRLNIYKKRSK